MALRLSLAIAMFFFLLIYIYIFFSPYFSCSYFSFCVFFYHGPEILYIMIFLFLFWDIDTQDDNFPVMQIPFVNIIYSLPKGSFILGTFIGGAACIGIWFGEGEIYCKYILYVVTAMLGAGGSIMLITSLSITADLIGPNIESGAFVYGAMSFTDKLSNGVAVMLIQNLNPCTWVFLQVSDLLGLAASMSQRLSSWRVLWDHVSCCQSCA